MRLKGCDRGSVEVIRPRARIHHEPRSGGHCQLIQQVRLELSDRMEASGVEFRWTLPEEKIILYLDGSRGPTAF